MSILICEDNALLALALSTELAERGIFDVVTASSAQQAFAVIETRTLEVAIVDLNLADGRTGASIARRLAELKIRTIVVSGDEFGGEELADCGYMFIRKPAPTEVIVDCIATALGLETARGPAAIVAADAAATTALIAI